MFSPEETSMIGQINGFRLSLQRTFVNQFDDIIVCDFVNTFY